MGANLWSVPLDAATGKPLGEPEKVSTWAGFVVSDLSVSRDGQRLMFTRTVTSTDIFAGELPTARSPRFQPERFTLDEANDRFPAFTPDGRLLFASDRRGGFDILAQGPDDGDARPITTGREWETWPELSPDGKLLLYWEVAATGEVVEPRLMRMPLAGGSAVEVLRQPSEAIDSRSGLPPPWNSQFACSHGAKGRCVLRERTDTGFTFVAFDPMSGRGAELARVATTSSTRGWALDPEGNQAAVLNGSEALITSLSNGRVRKVEVGLASSQYVAWTPDGDALLITGQDETGGFHMLRAPLAGDPVDVWHSSNDWIAHPDVSWDGKKLAVTVRNFESSIWMLEDF